MGHLEQCDLLCTWRHVRSFVLVAAGEAAWRLQGQQALVDINVCLTLQN